MVRKPILWMMPGPLHLFRTTGVFYLWLLARRYRVILVVPAGYRTNAWVLDTSRQLGVEDIHYLPGGGTLGRHVSCHRLFRRLADKHPPHLLLTHSRSYPENLYAIDAARHAVPGCIVVNFQNGRAPVDWAAMAHLQHRSAIARVQARYHLPERVASLAIRILRGAAYAINNGLLPILLTGRAFRPIDDVYAYRIKPENAALLNDDARELTLVYLPVEVTQYVAVGFPNVRQVEHPVRTAGIEARCNILGAGPPHDEILVLPSTGLEVAPEIVSTIGTSSSEYFATCWGDALAILRVRMPHARLGIKLHPSAADDVSWQLIIARLRQRFPDMVVYPPTDSAERLIAESSCLVSDVSTTLWWAVQIGEKLVVSLDIFKYIGGNEMRSYPGVTYVSDLGYLESMSILALEAPGLGMSVLDVIEGLTDSLPSSLVPLNA